MLFSMAFIFKVANGLSVQLQPFCVNLIKKCFNKMKERTKKMKIKNFTQVRNYNELMEEFLWQYYYPVEKLKKILVKQIY